MTGSLLSRNEWNDSAFSPGQDGSDRSAGILRPRSKGIPFLTVNIRDIFKNLLFTNTSNKQIFVKNSFWLFLAEGFNNGLIFLLTILIARHFGPFEFGQFSFASGFVTLFVILADFGINIYSTKEIARDRQLVTTYVENVIVIKALLGFLTLILIAVTINLAENNSEIRLFVYLLGLYVVLTSVNDFIVSVFRAFEKMEYEFLSKVIQGTTLFCLGLIFMEFQYGLRYIVSSYVVASSISFMAAIILLRLKFTKFSASFDLLLWKKILKESWPFALSGMFIIIYSKTNIVLLGFFKEQVTVGLYSGAANLLFFILFVGNIANSVLLPIFSRTGLSNHDFKKMLKWYFIASVGVASILVVFAPFIMNIVYGKSYGGAIPISRVISITLVFLLPNTLIGTYFASKNLQKYTLSVTAGLAVSNIFLNCFMIPLYSGLGAAAVTVFTEMLGTLLLFKKLRTIS
jgi:O-antigen/teichoic acid export membrane protein